VVVIGPPVADLPVRGRDPAVGPWRGWPTVIWIISVCL